MTGRPWQRRRRRAGPGAAGRRRTRTPAAGGLRRTDGPDGFVGDDQPAGELPVAVDGRPDLAVHKFRGGRRHCPRVGLPHAQQRRQPGVVRGPDLAGNHGVVFAEVPPAFGVADLNEPDAEFREHGRGHFPGPRPVRPAAVLRTEQQRRTAPGARRPPGRTRERRNDERDNPPGREGRTGVHFVAQPLQPVQAVLVAQVHLGADAHQDAGRWRSGWCDSAALLVLSAGSSGWALARAGVRPGGLTAPAGRRPCS